MIQISDLSKSFGGTSIVHNIDCAIARGLATVILGPSGAGKSVFAKLLVGLIKPDRGRIWIAGEEITMATERNLFKIREKIGMCFQDGALFNSLSVGENVAFPLRRHRRFTESEVRRVALAKLEMVGLKAMAEKMPTALSGGMRKRVGLARAIALDPELLILDEPTSGLDPIMANQIDDLIVTMKGTCTILAISHDLATTLALADEIAMIDGGKLVAHGARQDILALNHPTLRQFFTRLANSQPPTQSTGR